jgi:hypothetical protein
MTVVTMCNNINLMKMLWGKEETCCIADRSAACCVKLVHLLPWNAPHRLCGVGGTLWLY